MPGKPEPARYHALSEELGYRDELLITAEPYQLWAIEVPENTEVDRVRQVLSFHQADDRVIIQSDINHFRELKLRLLNGSHTLSCGLAFMSGFDTVSDAMADEQMAAFIRGLIMTELIPGLPDFVDSKAAEQFDSQLLDRYRNPFIEHFWLDITRQYSKKMLLRNVPTLVRYYQTHQESNLPRVTRFLPLGFAAYLLFMRATTRRDGLWYGERNGETYPFQIHRPLISPDCGSSCRPLN